MIYETDIYTVPFTVRIPLHQATGLTVGVQNLGRIKIFPLHQKHVDWLWVTPNLLFSRHRSSSLGLEFDHSSPSSAKVKNEYSYTSAPLVCVYWVDRNSFTFIFYIQLSSNRTNTLLSFFFPSFFLSFFH